MSSRDLVVAAAGSAGGAKDDYFKNVSLLLSGDGTNGAQNNTFLDSSTNNFTITRNGNTTQGSFSPYVPNWSNYFDGSGNYLTVPDNAAWDYGTNNFCIEFFTYVTANLQTYQIFVGQETSAGRLWVGLENQKLLFGINGGTIIIDTVNFPLNQWVHVKAQRVSGVNYLYKNGVLVNSASETRSINGSSALYIGANSNGATQTHVGYLSNLRILNNVSLSTADFTPPTSPLTAISGTVLLTCQSNRFIDNSSNNFTLTVNGNTSVQRFSPFNPTAPYSTATIGGSGYFDGSGDYLSVAANTALDVGSGDFTIEMFAFPFTKTNAVDAAFGYGNYTIMLYHNNTNWTLEMSNNGSSSQVTASFNVTLNAWQHIAIVKSGTSVTVYKNGVSAATGTISGSVNTSGKTLNVGRNGNAGQEFTGYLSNFRLVKGTAVYTSAFTPPTAPLTSISGTSLLCNMTNAGIPDAAMMNDLETVGNAQVSTSVKKYGTGSLAFDGTGDYLTAPASNLPNFGTGSFTLEGWVYFNTVSSTQFISQSGTDVNNRWILYFTAASGILFEVASGAALTISCAQGSSSGWATGTWYHIAVVRNGNVFNIYRNGTSVATVTDADAATNNNGLLYIGGSPFSGETTAGLNGYIDDLRITKGYARYTANFTPPAQALPTN